MTDARPLLFLDSAYKIARALTVAAARKDQAGEFDLQKVQDQVDALAAWSDRIADMATKARTIQNSGKLIEQCANDLKQDLDSRGSGITGAPSGSMKGAANRNRPRNSSTGLAEKPIL